MAEDLPIADIDAIAGAKEVESAKRIVGVAASAGGLEAISLLVQSLPQDSGASFVVAQHMSPTHKSMLSALISRETKLPVFDITDDMIAEPNSVYVTPPNSDVIYEDGKLRLCEPAGHPASPKPSADRLFKSLAEAFGGRSVGIVLSGTGSDGSYGVQAIHEAGGITIAQEPHSAKYDGMPTSAIETGCVDLALSPNQIGQHLEKILASPRDLDAVRPLVDGPNRLSELFQILLARTNIDFSDYKENTLFRRLQRRMLAIGIEDYEDYLGYCRKNASEVDALQKDFLISVTRFFRDPNQFADLRRRLAERVAASQDSSFRAWVVGCATGEEAYSIAIEIAEAYGGIEHLARENIQIFATDVDQAAVELARKGVYPIAAAQDIPPEYLTRYFDVHQNEIVVRRELRAATLFSRHNVIQDAPFINVDLASIRNVLIYFNNMLQERVLARLHYALAPDGLLFLGTSESVGDMSAYFEAGRSNEKVFSKRAANVEMSPQRFLLDHRLRRTNTVVKSRQEPSGGDLKSTSYLTLAKSVAPNGFLANKDGKIIEVLGEISSFLQIRSGSANFLNVDMLIDPLRSEVPSLISLALRHETRRDGMWHDVNLPSGNRIQAQVFPFQLREDREMECLVAINTRQEDDSPSDQMEMGAAEQRAYVKRIENEVRRTQEALQQTVEELQTSNEELQALNEELQSTNEEFQATNEELETANEELQSTNEELLTVNEELQNISTEKHALALELSSTLEAAPDAVFFVDFALMIRRASNVARRDYGLDGNSTAEVHLSSLVLPKGFPDIVSFANETIRLQKKRLIPVVLPSGFYQVRFIPVRDAHDRLFGLLITISGGSASPFERICQIAETNGRFVYWSHASEGGATYYSKEFAAKLEIDPEAEHLSIAQLRDSIHELDQERLDADFERLMSGSAPLVSDYRLAAPKGDETQVHITGYLISDEGAPVSQAVGVAWLSKADG